MSFAQRLISGRGPVTFDSLDRAAQLTETVEESRPMWKWVTDNKKHPSCFSEWPETIKAYHAAEGTRWIKNYAVPSPYGFMGYDIIKPPKVVAKPLVFGTTKPKSGLVTFSDSEDGCSELDDEDLLWDTDDFVDDDEDEDEDDDWSDDEGETKEKIAPAKEETTTDTINLDVVSNLFASPKEEKDDQPLHKSEDGDDNDTLLSEVSSLEELSDSDEEVFLEDCDYKCGIDVDPSDKSDCVCLHDIGGNYAHVRCHEKAKAKGLTLADIPKDTNIRDLPEGTRLEDLPRGAIITINESDIEWGSEIGSDDEDDYCQGCESGADCPTAHSDKCLNNPLKNEEIQNLAKLEEAIADDRVAVRPCKCGSTSHRRISHRSCPLNKKNTA